MTALSQNIRGEQFLILTFRISLFKSLTTFPHVPCKMIVRPYPQPKTLLKGHVVRIVIHFSFFNYQL